MSLRAVLRSETAAIHRQLDQLVDERQWFDDRAGYGRWLSGMCAFHDGIERALSRYAPATSDRSARCERLALDLADIGFDIAPPRPAARPEIRDGVDALGVRYVVEGARLGARVLLRRAAQLGCNESFGARYLSAEAASLEDWHAILAALDGVTLDEASISRAVAASTRTFALALDCLDGSHVA